MKNNYNIFVFLVFIFMMFLSFCLGVFLGYKEFYFIQPEEKIYIHIDNKKREVLFFSQDKRVIFLDKNGNEIKEKIEK